MPRATGTFDVKTSPQTPEGLFGDPLIGRFLLDKQFHGDLKAASKGEMLGAYTAVKGSAGYVAIERVTGTLGGRQGSFVLQHSGTMSKGVLHLSVTVIPDSATGQLAGLSGSMNIDASDGGHSYSFDYALA